MVVMAIQNWKLKQSRCTADGDDNSNEKKSSLPADQCKDSQLLLDLFLLLFSNFSNPERALFLPVVQLEFAFFQWFCRLVCPSSFFISFNFICRHLLIETAVLMIGAYSCVLKCSPITVVAKGMGKVLLLLLLLLLSLLIKSAALYCLFPLFSGPSRWAAIGITKHSFSKCLSLSKLNFIESHFTARYQ